MLESQNNKALKMVRNDLHAFPTFLSDPQNLAMISQFPMSMCWF